MGESFLFANRESDVVGTSPHSVFLQQGDDPIVWWDWDTLADEPDWLQEPWIRRSTRRSSGPP